MRVDPNAKSDSYTEEDIRTIVDVSHEDGVIEPEERDMINNVFDFGDATAKGHHGSQSGHEFYECELYLSGSHRSVQRG